MPITVCKGREGQGGGAGREEQGGRGREGGAGGRSREGEQEKKNTIYYKRQGMNE